MMHSIFVDKQGSVFNNGVQVYHFDTADFYVDGLIYTYGKKAGEETIHWLYDFVVEGKDIPYEQLHGAYSCLIMMEEKAISFSDNSNMHCIYYSENYISNSFLKMVDLETSVGTNLVFDSESLCEYLTIGQIFFGKTFFRNIHILESTEVIVLQNGIITVSTKGIGDIDQQSDLESISDYFEKVAYSISDYSVCQALTGGYDSRMVYACLSSKINDHVAITSNDTMNSDIVCAKETAAANGDELEIIPIPQPVFTDELFDKIILEADGIQPIELDSFIRLSTFKNVLSNRYNLLLTGDGGVMHKDWEWTQDLPFYRKKKKNPQRFYHQRLCYIDYSNKIGKRLYEEYKSQEERFVRELNKISKQLNTQSYDSWYYRVSGDRRLPYNASGSILLMYAPLLELDIVRYSYALPRYKRFFYNSMRDTISKENRNIARLKTNYGTTASNEMLYLYRDVFYQIAEYSRKACRLVGRKILNRNVMVKSLTGWSLENDVRRSNIADKAIEYAKKEELINSNVKVDDIGYGLLTRIIHVYWIARLANNA